MLNRSKIMGGLNSTTQSEHNHKKLCKNCMSAKIAQICKLVKVAQKLHSARSQFSGGTKYFADWLTSNLTEQKYRQIKHIQQQHNWCVTQFSLRCQHSTQPHTHTHSWSLESEAGRLAGRGQWHITTAINHVHSTCAATLAGLASWLCRMSYICLSVWSMTS